MNKKLLIIGAGEYGQITHEIAEAMGVFEKIDFLDDNSEMAVGKMCDIEKFAGEYSFGIAAVGNPGKRRELTMRLEENCYNIPVLVHPRAFVGKYASMRKGCIVEPMAVVHSGANLGDCVLVSAGAVVNHSSIVEAYSHVNVGAIVEAHSFVAPMTKIKEGEVFSGTNFNTEEKKQGTDAWIQEHIEKCGKEPNLFDGN